QPERHFAVNLFDSGESNIEPRPEIQIGYNEVKGQVGWAGARRELWKPLLLGALAVLCFEWDWYCRRVHLSRRTERRWIEGRQRLPPVPVSGGDLPPRRDRFRQERT